jgi:uncharacterized membrane protein
MTLYINILPFELRDLIELYIYPVRICVSIINIYDKPYMTLEMISDAIKSIADIIITCTVELSQDIVHIYQAYNKKHEFLPVDIDTNKLFRYHNVTQIIDDKNKYTWYHLPLLSTQDIRILNINLLKKELSEPYKVFRIKSEKNLDNSVFLDKIQPITYTIPLTNIYCLTSVVLL